MPDRRAPTRFIFVTGGVVSALGKGITAASIGRLLVSRGHEVTLQKFDPYINVDPGTMSPFQVDEGRDRCMFVHVTLVPFIQHAGELKTKPTQHSVQELRRIGIQPDMIVCRCAEPLERDIRAKIGLFANLPVESIISARDADSIYKVPLYFRAEGIDDRVLDHFGIDADDKPDLSDWEAMVRRRDQASASVRIAMAG